MTVIQEEMAKERKLRSPSSQALNFTLRPAVTCNPSSTFELWDDNHQVEI